MGGHKALLAANLGGALAVPLAKDCNHRTIPEIIKSLKALPEADTLILHPILAEALYEHYGRNNGPEMEYLRRLDCVITGGGKLAKSVADKLIAAGVNLVRYRYVMLRYMKVCILTILFHRTLFLNHPVED